MIIEQDTVITMSDARQKGGCVNGWKTFIEFHGFEWKEVVLNGLLASQLLALDDAMATELVVFVYERDNLL